MGKYLGLINQKYFCFIESKMLSKLFVYKTNNLFLQQLNYKEKGHEGGTYRLKET